MFDRMDKKNNVIGFKTNSALALFTSILAENKIMLINTYLFQKELLVFYAKWINQPHVLNISVPEKILLKKILKTFLLFEICNMFLSCNANIAQWFLYDLYEEGVLCAVNQ